MVKRARLTGGTIHGMPNDLHDELLKDSLVVQSWESLTELARNEFICWVDSAKQDTTRMKRITRVGEELREGKRRPCCWPGCPHHNPNAQKWH